MKKIYFKKLDPIISLDGLKEMMTYLRAEIVDSPDEADFVIETKYSSEIKGYEYELEEGHFIVQFDRLSAFYRAVNHLLSGDAVSYYENRNFEELSVSIDLSRNAVFSDKFMQEYLCRLVSLGYDTCFLYMEDMYQIDGYPYFGYLRGRYSPDDLRAFDSFAVSIGLELVPAIQTLSHLERPLKWKAFDEVKDTECSLLVDEESTYELIDAMIKVVSSCFHSERIHIGMDEALELGLGNHLLKNNYSSKEELFILHLDRVLKVVARYHKKPLIWSDMLLRILSPGGEYYDNVQISESYISKLPEVALVYWDYYHDDINDYKNIIDIHKKMTKELYFAGGIWLFNGIAPNYGRMFTNTVAAIEACMNKCVKHLMATIWLDDGAETPIETSYLGIQLFSEAQFSNNLTREEVGNKFRLLQGLSAEAYWLLDQFDQTPGVAPNNPYSSAVSKVILYQDSLLGLYDKNIEGLSLGKHYDELEKALSEVEETPLFVHYKKLANILSKKSELGLQINEHYQLNDKSKLKEDLKTVQMLVDLYIEYEECHARLWNQSYKKLGWEVLNRRYYGVIGNLKNTERALTAHLENNKEIQELNITKLPYSAWYESIEGCIATNFYKEIPSVNGL